MKIDDEDIMIMICTHVITINCTCIITINRSGVVAYRRLRWIRTVWRQLNNVSKNIVYEERHQLFINQSLLYLYLLISQLKLPPLLTHSHTHTITHLLNHTLTHSLTHSVTHSIINSVTPSITFSLTLSHTH